MQNDSHIKLTICILNIKDKYIIMFNILIKITL